MLRSGCGDFRRLVLKRGEVIEFPEDQAEVASDTPNFTERDEGNTFAVLGLDFSN